MDDRLDPLVGEWKVRASFGATGTTRFEWALDRAFLVQHGTIDDPAAPDTLAVIAPDGDGFRQHYFDARGVVRLYAMTFVDGVWTLSRDEADFSPLSFPQRFVAEVGEDVIRGRWERDGELDFELVYARVAG